MKIYRIASPSSNDSDIKELKEKIKDINKSIKEIEKDHRPFEKLQKRMDEVEKLIKELNIGSRRFWQATNIFTSLQRKIERFDVVEQEWKKFKEEIDGSVKREIEKKFKAQIK